MLFAAIARQDGYLNPELRKYDRDNHRHWQAGIWLAQAFRSVCFMMVKAAMTVRYINLVVPLASKATDMRTEDTTGE